MDILNSNWLVGMLKKAGNTPQTRLLSLFDILNDWTDAPGINVKIELNAISHASVLQNYLSLEAAKAGAALPEMLASQLYFMAFSAMQEKLQGNNKEGMQHAKNAALALITAQTKKEFRIAKSSAYAIAASFIGALAIAGGLFAINHNSATSSPQVAALAPSSQHLLAESQLIANPKDTAALIAEINQMRKGSCQLIEALQLPDSYKKVYFENIVLGQISTNPSDQKLVRELLQKVRCNYTPMLMANSRG
jgi:hypothetical protein